MKYVRFCVLGLILGAVTACPALAQDSLHISRIWQSGLSQWPYAYDVEVRNGYAFLAAQSYGLRIINVSNPASPTQTGNFPANCNTMRLDVAGSYVYAAAGTDGLKIINVSNPASPTLAGTYNTPGSARGVVVRGSYAYVADGNSGLRIINVTNPDAPFQVGFWVTPAYAYELAVVGNYAYVGMNGGLQIIDVSTAAAPVPMGVCPLPIVYDVAVSGNYAYVVMPVWNGGVAVVDISDPTAPLEVGSRYNTAGDENCVKVRGNYLYVAADTLGLRVFDISAPTALAPVGYYNTIGNALGVAVDGNAAYVGDYNYFGVYDISYFAPNAVPCAPEQLVITPLADQVRLTWLPVTQDINGQPITVAYYGIYSAGAMDSTVFDSVGAVFPPETSILLDGIAPAQGFYYVKAVAE